jgi:diketogulonate reductase-like aldo/keto reductase
MQKAWRTMEELQRSGKTKSIGVSNYAVRHLQPLLSYCEIKPVINQIEIHPYFPNTELINFCRENDIMPVAYSPLGSQGQTKKAKENQTTVLTDPTLEELAREKGCSVAQICIAWGIKRGYPVLPKSANEGRVRANFELVSLTGEEMKRVDGIAATIGKGDGKGVRLVNPIGMFGFNVWEGEDV